MTDPHPPVRAVYDRIAAHFSATRAYPWPDVEEFLEGAPRGGLGLDVGCGNARHVPPLAERVERVLALDASRPLLAEARERVAGLPVERVQGDARALPVADGRVDVGLYVATVHHLETRAGRLRSLDELARVLAPGGRALVSAWSSAHDRFDADGEFDTTVDWTLPGGETVPRFYHVYDLAGFEADLADSDLSVLEAFTSEGNCFAVVGP